MASMSLETVELSGKETNELWKVVEQIVLEEYDFIKNMYMRNGYYHIRERLSKQIGKTITHKQFCRFEVKYDYYQSDKWPSWEKEHGIVRPICKDPTFALYNGNNKPLAYIEPGEFDFPRCQGFIFIEKSGFLNDLKLLSHYGWIILAGQGYSSREVREQLDRSYPDATILLVHDNDGAGRKMVSNFFDGTKRTKHLNLKFPNAFDLGLRDEDVEEFDLPKEPETKKYRNEREWRVELNALTVLITRRNIKNPLFWYITKRMKEEGIALYKEEQSSIEALKWAIRFRIESAIGKIVEEIVTKTISSVKDELLIEVALPEEKGIKIAEEQVRELAQFYLEGAEYVDLKETEQDVLFESQVISEKEEIQRRRPEIREEES